MLYFDFALQFNEIIHIAFTFKEVLTKHVYQRLTVHILVYAIKYISQLLDNSIYF